MAKSKTAAEPEAEVLPPRKPRKELSLTVRLDEPTMAWLEDAARRRGLGLSTAARMFMLKGLANEPSPPDGDWVTL